MKASIKISALRFLGLFNLARSLCYKIGSFNPNILNFYSRFVKKNDLCFDIGANIGRKTDIFLNLGARVIAVEPNPECYRFLSQKYRFNKKIILVKEACGHKVEVSDLFLCKANALSTMSPQWIESARRADWGKEFEWNKKIKVSMTTLDKLILQYGQPCYCKIDVEGYDINVIKGLSTPIPFLSFEFSPETVTMARDSVRYLSVLGFDEFNFSEGESPIKMSSKNWLSYVEIASHCNDLLAGKYGEIYARCSQLYQAGCRQ